MLVKLNPIQQKKYEEYKMVLGVSNKTALMGALGNAHALKRIEKAKKRYYGTQQNN